MFILYCLYLYMTNFIGRSICWKLVVILGRDDLYTFCKKFAKNWRKMVLFSHETCTLTKVNRKGPFSFAPFALFFKTMVISGHILFDFFITCTKECKLKFFSPPCRVINIVGSYQTHDVSRTPVCFGFFKSRVYGKRWLSIWKQTDKSCYKPAFFFDNTV